MGILYNSKPMQLTTKVSLLKLLKKKEKFPALSDVFPTPDLAKYTEAQLTGSLVWPSIIVPDKERDWPMEVLKIKTKTKDAMMYFKMFKKYIL